VLGADSVTLGGMTKATWFTALLLLSFLAAVFGACKASPPTGGAGGEGGATSAGVGGAGGEGGSPMICEPYSKRPCYTGPADTRNVGTCLDGFSICNAIGTGFGFCEGEITPRDEVCAKPDDEDCDGVANEGCP
jgi:hypothetical protein